MKYKVTGYKVPVKLDFVSEFDIIPVIELKEEYGLHEFTNQQIYDIWSKYSEEYYCAGWLVPRKELIEDAFGVLLEEVKE